MPAVPEIVGVVVLMWAAGAVTVGAGARVSMTNVKVALSAFPAASPWLTLIVYWLFAARSGLH